MDNKNKTYDAKNVEKNIYIGYNNITINYKLEIK